MSRSRTVLACLALAVSASACNATALLTGQTQPLRAAYSAIWTKLEAAPCCSASYEQAYLDAASQVSALPWPAALAPRAAVVANDMRAYAHDVAMDGLTGAAVDRAQLAAADRLLRSSLGLP